MWIQYSKSQPDHTVVKLRIPNMDINIGTDIHNNCERSSP